MPAHLSIQDGILHVSLTGVVSDADLRETAGRLEELERSEETVPHRITHLDEATRIELTFADLWELAKRRRALSLPNRIKSAIIAPDPVHVGFARMFQTLNDHPLIEIAIFPDSESAVKWIGGNGAR
jgi:regulation of enolase protein 1 (concanavalin A-like superfamily)